MYNFCDFLYMSRVICIMRIHVIANAPLPPTQLKQTENRHTPGTFSFPTKIRKKLTIFWIVCILLNTNTIRRSNANTLEIAQEPSEYLTFEALLPKNRVWFSVYQGSWDFRDKFSRKKCVAQFAYGFGVYGATAHLGAKWGALEKPFPVRRELKRQRKITVNRDQVSLKSPFPFGGN